MKRFINKQKKLSMYFITLCMLFIGCFFQGCKKDWLEAKSDKKLAVPETVKDFQAILDNYNEVNAGLTPILSEVASDGHYYIDSYYSSLASSSPQLQNAYSWQTIHQYETLPSYLFQYYVPYSSVLDCNIILDGITRSKDVDQGGLEHVKAQALFHRARIFFNLAQTFATQFKASSANTDLGIALGLSTDITEPSVRSSVKQTYEKIISDLNIAKDILPNAPTFLTRASKPAALGLLAKVYLTMGDYENAFNSSNQYLNIKKDLLDYSTINSSLATIGVNQEVAFLSFLTASQFSTSRYLIDQSLYDSYSIGDLRKQVYFKIGTGNAITFKGSYGNSSTDIFAGIATDEIYLIRAECYARKGDIISAMKDLNDLLRTRWSRNPDGSTRYIDQVASNETDALNRIFIERRKELILRNVRWSDLRRLNLDDRFKVTLIRTIGGKTYTLEPNSLRYTFPLPIEAIQRSNMQQNPGW